MVLLASLALLKVLPRGKLRIGVRVWWWASIAVLVIVLVPFSVSQVRNGLFPQTGRYTQRTWTEMPSTSMRASRS